ncbi:MAG: efflux RND transporter periplasmic adaptor subunit [Chitinophagaceae bacterium]|nr:efflux RND transporter periplasmic adaptor subunit [Chitinophagaceae bacterium]
MNLIKTYLTVIFSYILMLSCGEKSQVESPASFALTDTMMARISLDTVVTEPVASELKLSGKVTPGDNKVASIFPIVAGYVTKVNVSLGDHVKKGQVLAVIRSTDIADFEKQRRDGETELLLAKKNLKAAEELNESKLNTDRDVVAARKAVDDAEAELNRISEVLRIYHVNNGTNYNVIAPISGFVTDKNLNVDMQLPSGYSESIFTIAQIDEIYVTANVFETDISKISPDMPAEVEILSYSGKKFRGRINKIMNILDPETKTMKVQILLPNPGYALKPEMAATVYLHYQEPLTLPSVPAEAVVFDKSRNYLMIFHRQDSIETRMVEPERTTRGKTYITSGLAAGEKVIVKNALLIYDAIND